MKKTSPHTITIQIDSLSNSGDGVGRFNNKVIFVPFALPGEQVSIEIVQDKKTFAKGRLIKVLETSSHRVTPRCQVFGQCGGCDWQNLDYEQQLYWKQKNLVDVLQRIGHFENLSSIEKIQPAPQPFSYRNRIQIHRDRKGFYFFGKGSRDRVYISSCPIASEAINQFIKQSGQPSSVQQKIELAEMDNARVEIFNVDDVGQSELGFRQVNNAQNQFINFQIQNLVSQKSITKVVDLYCGQGNWSIQLGNNLEQVQCMGIDNNPINIQKAQQKAPSNCQFQLGDAIELLKKQKDWRQLIIIDPPRAGCSPEVIDQLNAEPSDWLVYISCHPATMARDLNHLKSSGWKIHRIVPVDMFPQTAHLECLTILRSAKSLKTANP